MPKRPVTVRIARWSAEHPWRAILLWVAFVAVCFAGGTLAGTNELSDEDTAIGEAGRASLIVDSGNFEDPTVENVLITARTGQLDSAAAQAAAADITARMRALPQVASVEPAVPASDGSAVLVRVIMSGEPHTATERVRPLQDTTAAVQRDHPALRVEQAGNASIDNALSETLDQDFRRAELLSVPVSLLILLVAFGALIAASVPVILALSSVVAALGLSMVASHLVPADDNTASVVLLIGMAVGVDYSLFYLRREREERAKGRTQIDAVEIAAATSGHAVVVSGIAVTIAMAGLLLARDSIFASIAVGSMLVVAVAVVGSITVLPAILAKMGRWVDRLRVPVLWRMTAQRERGPRFWPAVLRPALRHPLVTFLVSVGVLLALATPVLGMKLKFPGIEDLPRTTAEMRTYDRLVAAFPSRGTRHLVAVRAPAGRTADIQAALVRLSDSTRGNPLYVPVEGEPHIDVSADGRVAFMSIATPNPGRTPEAERSLTVLRDTLVPAALSNVDGVEYAVGGAVAQSRDYAAHVRQKLPLVIGFVLLLTFIVMAFTFRSVVVALTSIALNLLSAGAAYGLLVLVFQGTWAEGLLGFTSMGAIVSWLPLFLFVVLFGLSMDYHVFVVSRIREAVLGGMPTREAIGHGITTSAGVVTSAALVMVGVFAIFATLSLIDFKQLGIGLAAAILLDATIIRAVVLPSLMALLGNANWWAPAFMRRTEQPAADVESKRELDPVG